MRNPLKWSLLAFCVCLPLTAEAHRTWMLPSATVLSGDDVWVTVDAAVSNDLFYFEHFPLRIANIGIKAPDPTGGRGGRGADLHIIAPDGSNVEAQNGAMGRYRSTFDVHLTQKGTYKFSLLNGGAFASYKVNGETKRWRGETADFEKNVPADAEGLQSTLMQSRMEIFVTSGKPTKDTLKVTGKGLELDPITHPNDLVSGSPSSFRLLLDGKPAPDLKVTVIPGGIRYRDNLGEMTLKTDSEGKFSVNWPDPGMYWMEAAVRDDNTGGIKGLKQRRASYIATLEVMPQ
jgi:uncharacterized GH25 family protein